MIHDLMSEWLHLYVEVHLIEGISLHNTDINNAFERTQDAFYQRAMKNYHEMHEKES